MAQLRGNSTVGGQPIIHLGNLKHFLKNSSTNIANDISFTQAGFSSTTVGGALNELTLQTRAINTGAGLSGGGNLTTDRTISVSFGGNGSATTVARSDHSHALTNISDVTITSPAANHILQHDGSKWVNRTLATANVVSTGTAVNTGPGLSGGGDLTTSRTLSVSFGGNGSATNAARSDHNHDSTYVNLTSGTKQVVTSNVDLNGEVNINGRLLSPIPTTPLNAGANVLSAYPLGFSFGHTGTATGYPSPNGTLISFNESASRNVQIFHSKNTNKLHVRTHSDSTGAWLPFSGLALDEDVSALENRSIATGSGLTGGGNLTASRTLSVNFAGTGSATTVARSDHNHDGTYVKRVGDSMTGLLTFGAGQATTGSTPATGIPTQGIVFSFDTDLFRVFGREDSSGETNHLVIQLGDNPDDGFQIEGMDTSSSTPVTLFDLDKVNGTRINTPLSTTGAISEQGTSLVSKYAAIGRAINAGSGLTGGGNLTADRTLSVNFAGTGSATTVARSDHNHDTRYVNLTGAAQTITSPLTINSLAVSGSFSSPLGTAASNDGNLLLDVVPYGLSWGSTGVSNPNVVGYPAITGSVLSFQEGVYRNFQLFHEKNTHNLYLRTINDWTLDWMPFRRFAMYDELTTQSLQIAKSSKDSNGVFTVVEFRRKTDGYLVARSTLTGGTSPQYTTRVLQHFDGTASATLVRTDTFTLSYDSDGDLYLEV